MPVFPSVEWFQTAADVLNKSDSFKRLGTCDAEVGMQVDDEFYEVDFEAFEVKDVRKIDERRAKELDFVLVQPYDRWKAMLEDIKTNGRATHDFTLNSLDLQSEESSLAARTTTAATPSTASTRRSRNTSTPPRSSRRRSRSRARGHVEAPGSVRRRSWSRQFGDVRTRWSAMPERPLGYFITFRTTAMAPWRCSGLERPL